jgi:hypothetical protein
MKEEEENHGAEEGAAQEVVVSEGVVGPPLPAEADEWDPPVITIDDDEAEAPPLLPPPNPEHDAPLPPRVMEGEEGAHEAEGGPAEDEAGRGSPTVREASSYASVFEAAEAAATWIQVLRVSRFYGNRVPTCTPRYAAPHRFCRRGILFIVLDPVILVLKGRRAGTHLRLTEGMRLFTWCSRNLQYAGAQWVDPPLEDAGVEEPVMDNVFFSSNTSATWLKVRAGVARSRHNPTCAMGMTPRPNRCDFSMDTRVDLTNVRAAVLLYSQRGDNSLHELLRNSAYIDLENFEAAGEVYNVTHTAYMQLPPGHAGYDPEENYHDL